MILIFQNPASGANIVSYTTDATHKDIENFTILQIKDASGNLGSVSEESGDLQLAKTQAVLAGITLIEGKEYNLAEFKSTAVDKGINLIMQSKNSNTGAPYEATLVSVSKIAASVTEFAFGEQSAASVLSSTLQAGSLSPASGNITVAATGKYTVSKDNITFGASVTFAYTEGKLYTPQALYVKYTPTVNGADVGTITYSGGGASSLVLDASGTGIEF